MATAPPSQDPKTVVRTSTALWSEIVRGVLGGLLGSSRRR